MKSCKIILLVILSIQSYSSLAQNQIESYTVKENINMKFGGYTTSYIISDLSLVKKFYLGPNNTRTITTNYNLNPDQEIQNISVNKHIKVVRNIAENNNNPDIEKIQNDKAEIGNKFIQTIDIQTKYAYISIIEIYKRIVEKGYKSADLFKKLGNTYYLNNELDKAAKWYTELFKITEQVEPEYFYRYSQTLKVIGNKNKADEMLTKYNQKSNN